MEERTMNATILKRAVASLGIALAAAAMATQPAQAHSWRPLVIKDQGAFFVGGRYDQPVDPTYMYGQMYVRYQIPLDKGRHHHGKWSRAKKLPVVMIHGGGQLGTSFTGTPDDRPGWADYFLREGWPVYVVDQPGRGRSIYVEAVYGERGMLNIEGLEDRFTATREAMLWPQAALHTQWPGSGKVGSYPFDQFIASQARGMADARLQEQFTSDALVALLDKIGPAVLLTHSQSGPHGWLAADRRPDLVKALLVVEPNGPPFYSEDNTTIDRPHGITRLPLTFSPAITDPSQLTIAQQAQPDAPDLFRCWLQSGQPRQLPNLAGIPILLVTGEASFRAQYDHCTAKFLEQAGVENDHVNLGDVGIHGNGHMMMLERNNLRIAAFMERWLERKVGKKRWHGGHGQHHAQR
jgi:pimeloyl-ACP methyl ester carboxylesterase